MSGYFMSTSQGIAFVVRSYLHFFVQLFLKSVFFCPWPYRMQMFFKQIYMISRWDSNKYYLSGPELTWKITSSSTLTIEAVLHTPQISGTGAS